MKNVVLYTFNDIKNMQLAEAKKIQETFLNAKWLDEDARCLFREKIKIPKKINKYAKAWQ